MEELMKNRQAVPWPPEHLRCLKRKEAYRFAALTWGSRGDVQPFVALGAELVRRGHSVVLAAREPFRALAEEQGIEFHAMAEDGTEKLMRSLAGARGFRDMVQISSSYSRGLIRSQFHAFADASRGADVILTKAVSTAPALHIAEQQGVPVFFVHIDPGFIPSEDYCMEGDRYRNRGKLINRFMGRMMLMMFGLSVSDLIHAWRQEQGLPADRFARHHQASYLFRFPAFAVWSTHFLKRSSDWPSWYVQTGWWKLKRKTSVGNRLREFVRAGPPPFYFGFGSWTVHERTAVTDVILEAVRLTDNRAVLLRNTVDGRTEFPSHVIVEEDVSHDAVLPHLKAAVHHGGAGTMGAVAAAGIPSIIVPGFPAQATWGHLAEEMHIGTLLDRRNFTVENLAAAMRAVDLPDVRERARVLGNSVRNEGGEKQAADEIERRLREATEKSQSRPLPGLAKLNPTFTLDAYVENKPSPGRITNPLPIIEERIPEDIVEED
jgi:sterol 3beta-glucosyltransferase